MAAGPEFKISLANKVIMLYQLVLYMFYVLKFFHCLLSALIPRLSDWAPALGMHPGTRGVGNFTLPGDFLVGRCPELSVPDDAAHADVLREQGHYRGDDPAPHRPVTGWLHHRRGAVPDPVLYWCLDRLHAGTGGVEDLAYVRRVVRSRVALRRLRPIWNRRIAVFRGGRVTRPAPPPAVAPRDDADGWGAIDAVDVVDCAVSVFQMAQDLGGRDQEWVIAVGDALALWERGDERGVERGLKWFLILPQLLLRKASRGGKRGRGELNARSRA